MCNQSHVHYKHKICLKEKLIDSCTKYKSFMLKEEAYWFAYLFDSWSGEGIILFVLLFSDKAEPKTIDTMDTRCSSEGW